MPYVVPKSEAPHLNKAARKRLFRERQSKISPRFSNAIERDGYECFDDASYYDMWCIRPQGSRDFNNTVHVSRLEQAEIVIDWLAGRRDDIPFKLVHDDRDRGLLSHWKTTLAHSVVAVPGAQ